MTQFPMFIRVASLAVGQSYDWPNARDVNLKDMGETDVYIF